MIVHILRNTKDTEQYLTLESESDEAFSSSNNRELDKDRVAACDANGNIDKI
jgi:hypothetical protein